MTEHRSQINGKALARDALGLGLRVVHYPELFELKPALDYFEIISENFMSPAWPVAQNLQRVLEHYPLVMHGVGLNLLGHEPLNEAYLDQLCLLADRVGAAFVTDHLCWTGAHGVTHHDLLPTPYTKDLVAYAAERIAYVQKRLGRPFGVENLSSYVRFQQSEMSEWQFYSEVVQAADAHFMLDINNVYVSSQNHGDEPWDFLRRINYDRVLQVHIAGHERQADGSIIDTHDRPVADAVWDLYQRTWALAGPFPTLLEWDAHIPSLPEVLEELSKARRYQT